MKKLFVDGWEYRKAVKFDDDMMILSVEGNPIVKVNAQRGYLKLAWLAAKWGSWK